MDFTVLIHPTEEGGYWAEVPAFPGCFTQGETIEETLQNAKDAIECHIEALKEDGQPIVGDAGLIISRVQIAA